MNGTRMNQTTNPVADAASAAGNPARQLGQNPTSERMRLIYRNRINDLSVGSI